jgi:cysteine desulfuration protein SufE
MTPTVSLPDRELEILQTFEPIMDLRDRLEAIVDWGLEACGTLSEEEQVDAHRVNGCVSRVWLVCDFPRPGMPYFRVKADSQLVQGLAGAHLRFYEGCSAAQICEFPPVFWHKLKLPAIVSATRQRGMEAFYQTMCELAFR